MCMMSRYLQPRNDEPSYIPEHVLSATCILGRMEPPARGDGCSVQYVHFVFGNGVDGALLRT